MTITIEIAEDGALLLPLQGAALGRKTQAALREHYRRELQDELENDERVKAWHQVARHPFFTDCYPQHVPLIDSMIAKLDTAVVRERKVWHDAQKDDVWIVTRALYPEAQPIKTVCTVGTRGNFIDAHARLAAFDITDGAIVDAERIYPREESA